MWTALQVKFCAGGAVVFLVVSVTAGCNLHTSPSSAPLGGKEVSAFTPQIVGGPPNLTSNEVLSLAVEIAQRNKRFRTGDYACTGWAFGGPGLTNKWIVYFQRIPPVPDDAWFVFVEDETRKVEIWHP